MIVELKMFREDFKLPLLGLGTWGMGGEFKRDMQNDDQRDINAIRNAISVGIRHLDTAEIYADGYAERIIAKAKKNIERSSLFITSKVWNSNLRYNDLINAAQNSLHRLETSYIDLYLIHRPDESVPIRETMMAMNYLASKGLIKNIGVSNFDANQIIEAQKYSQSAIVANQVHYNLFFRQPETQNILSFCQNNKIALIAWRPLKDVMSRTFELGALKKICDKYKKTPAQVAINWLISQPSVVTISTMRTPAHLMENLGALDWKMETKDIELLRKKYSHFE